MLPEKSGSFITMKIHKIKNGKAGKIHTFSLGGKLVLWFPGINKYLVVQPGIDEIIKLIWEDPANSSIVEVCQKKFDIDELQANKIKDDFIKYIEENIKSNNLIQPAEEIEGRSLFADNRNISKKYYNIYDRIFMVEYESEWAKELNHPKFAYLEISPTKLFDHHFRVFHSEGQFTLEVDGKSKGSWEEADSHFLGGKFSMQILQKINDLEEEGWLGVFHAAGVTDGNNCIMFFGDSGNGKSTLSALLMANGLDVLSDDFLPVTSNPELVYRFPAALSIKKTAYKLVSSTYNELNQAEEHYSPLQDKIFRYLPPLKTQQTAVPCKAIIHVKYQKDAGLNLEEMPHEEAFQHLVPDSWISPEPENARRFVHWFNQLPCYRLTYSDNPKMVETIKNLFNNGLS
jgi:hypothetical protein